MAYLYLGLVSLVTVCTAMVPFVKRAGDRSWAKHLARLRRRQQLAELRAKMRTIREQMKAVRKVVERAAATWR